MAAFAFSSETGALREVLLCRPDNYDWLPLNAIAVETIAEGHELEREAAQAQYGEMVAALENAGVACRYLEPEPHLQYQVYTRDSSQVTPWGPVLTQLCKTERRGEYAAVLAFYQAAECPIWRYSTAGTLEGGDIHLIRPGLACVGYSGVRSDLRGARQFAGWLEDEGWEVRLQPFAPHFLHLDVLFCMAAEGLAVACEEVLDESFLAWLRDHGTRWIPVPYKSAMQLGCNLLALGQGQVISPRHNTDLNAALRAEGLEVLDPELDLFTRGGGGVHCMTMPLRRDEA